MSSPPNTDLNQVMSKPPIQINIAQQNGRNNLKEYSLTADVMTGKMSPGVLYLNEKKIPK